MEPTADLYAKLILLRWRLSLIIANYLRGLERKVMTSEDFVISIKDKGYQNAGLCMFAPKILASIANRMLNEVYNDSGDNLSVLMRGLVENDELRYMAGNYSSAPLDHVRNSIDVLEKIPGAVMLIAESGVGGKAATTLGLLENGRTIRFEDRAYSFFSFAEEHLSLELAESETRTSSIEDMRQKVRQAANLELGTKKEIDARRELLGAIDDFERNFVRTVEPEVHGGIGHNQPPPELTLPENIAYSIKVNILIIREEIQSEGPDLDQAIEAASALNVAGEELVDFFRGTKKQVKVIGSKTLATAIVSGIILIIWNFSKWMSAVLGLSLF